MNEKEKMTLWERIYNGVKQMPEKFDNVVDAGQNVLSNAIFGKEVLPPESTINKNADGVLIQTGVNNGGRKGGLMGFVNDTMAGVRDNAGNSFQPSNLYPVQNKGFGYRFGEGLGTTARLLDNPLVRGAVAYGLSKRMGDTNPLEQGLVAAGTTMQNRTADKFYRNQLKALGMLEEDVNNIPGYVTGDIYKNISDTYKARWNKTSWGDLANFNPKIAEVLKANPALANTYVPASVANTILKGDLTDAQITNLLAQANAAGVRSQAAMMNAQANKNRSDSTVKLNDFIMDTDGNTTGGMTMMQSSDGRVFKVPNYKVQDMIKAGGKVIG